MAFKEIQNLRQNPGEPPRRWFYDSFEQMDLIIWQDAEESITSFQLYYSSGTDRQYAITWRSDEGFTHDRVDDGEHRPGKYKAAPLLTPGENIHHKLDIQNFTAACEGLDPKIADFVRDKLMEHGKYLA